MVEADPIVEPETPARVMEAPDDGMRPRAAKVRPDRDRARRDVHQSLS